LDGRQRMIQRRVARLSEPGRWFSLMGNMIAVMRWLQESGFDEVSSHVVGHL
jgi:hypothetical protein